ncbi:177_t:CDS:10 [Acaulospora morrowiae]|uniref:DNA topoisomerase 2 n=1 Tax=Acaulospora morrowiae TaxID=94023 RepID=A0A9N9G229_9GLOM|nr:177_t:CDS:10 [Acaulospora morrowiae]
MSDSDDFPSPVPKGRKQPKKITKTKEAKTTRKSQKSNNDFMTFDEPIVTNGESSLSSRKGKKIEEIYQKKTQLEHILLRPDTYIGSTEIITEKLWVYDSDTDTMQYRDVSIAPGLYKIVDEILVNAADNKIRDPSMNTIRVKIDKQQNLISIYNNGKGIPIEVHKEEGIYVPELIFGHLLTSSNYDDNEKKVTGGRNGYGAKLTNIFSTEFIVETADKSINKKYKQVFRNNMSVTEKPQITSYSKKDEYTEITFKPDLAKFNLTELTDDIVALLKKRVYDLAGCVNGVKVYLNDERVQIRNFKDYVMKYLSSSVASEESSARLPFVHHEIVNDRWEVAVAASTDGQFQQVSFVNSIATTKGGTHVTHVLDQLIGKIIETVKKNKEVKDAKLKPFLVKNHLWIFINCLIENPSFDSQTKETLTLRQHAFGSKCNINDKFVEKVLKSEIVEEIIHEVKSKQESELKKSDGGKKSKVTTVEKLSDAKNAGSRKSAECTLILTEGDSAKTLAVAGLSAVGRDSYGVFPLKGKLLNVREASTAQILKNEEIQNIKKILGLQHNKNYTSVNDLRYGHLMIMADQDHDGSHIKGLIINFLDHFYPSLMRIPGFLKEFITPIVRGLGTSSPAEAKEYFSAINQHMKPFREVQDGERALIDMAFNKKRADERKEWLRNYTPGTYIDYNVSEITVSNFINQELILFSMADNVRSIPSVLDGLKPGQRKVLFCCFKRNLTKEIKVIQLAGYVSEHSAYHHGEASLHSTIVTMANNFIGSNNVNLLEPSGQFGSRIQGGKDSASPRYINTKLNPLTRLIFNPHDDNLLKYLNDDGNNIEPEWYLPIIPMVLVNGSEGIGTGWSTSIPNFNPSDIVANLKRLMEGKELEPMHPWYRGFRGTIEKISGDKYKNSGIMERDAEVDNMVHVIELPIKIWTQNYENDLKKLMPEDNKSTGLIKGYHDVSTLWRPNFEILLEDHLAEEGDEELEKKLKIISSLTTSNMVCFDREGRLKKYSSPGEILEEFYHLRLEYYFKRKDYLLKKLELECKKLQNKNRFIKMKIDHELEFEGLKKVAIVNLLERKGFDRIPHKVEDAEGEEDENIGDYDYLMKTPAWSFSEEEAFASKCQRQYNEKNIELSILRQKHPKQLWNEDLDEFLKEWESAENEFNRMVDEAPKKDEKKNRRKIAKVTSKGKTKSSDLKPEEKTKPKVAEVIKAKPVTKSARGIKKASQGKKQIDDYFSLKETEVSGPSAESTDLSDVEVVDLSSKRSADDDPDERPVTKQFEVPDDSDSEFEPAKRNSRQKVVSKKPPAKPQEVFDLEDKEEFPAKVVSTGRGRGRGRGRGARTVSSRQTAKNSADAELTNAVHSLPSKRTTQSVATKSNSTHQFEETRSPEKVLTSDESEEDKSYATFTNTKATKSTHTTASTSRKTVKPKVLEVSSDEDEDMPTLDQAIMQRITRPVRAAASKRPIYVDLSDEDMQDDDDDSFRLN